ncbi:protein of unknown function [Candidatus Nitrosocosmicus franklandus]|uniref:Uncharacterized protein n=1 Tax=Candidatus Nitrosocosmicus franklandianus TaxID=1798806 RepID=A0A484I8Y0_9ARCH|nr:protein of unknown function [Candidatus Nitrosocosmicus franklandus]
MLSFHNLYREYNYLGKFKDYPDLRNRMTIEKIGGYFAY